MPVIAIRITSDTLAYIDKIRGTKTRSTATKALINYLEQFGTPYGMNILGTKPKEQTQNEEIQA